MLKTLRDAMRGDGLTVLLAVGAIAWGVTKLQRIADDRQARLAELDAAIAQREGTLEAAAAAVREAAVQHRTGYPAPEDLDPLGRADAEYAVPRPHASAHETFGD